jgi:hypothetical protein
MSKHKHTPVHRHSKPGEGASLSVSRKQSVDVAGATGVSLSIDFTSAPVPDRRYAADIATVVRTNDMVNLIFGQTKVSGTEFRSLLIIHLSAAAVHQTLRSLQELLPTIRKYERFTNLAKVDLTDVDHEPSQTVALTANLVAVSHSGREACLDFYYSSPWVILQVKNGGEFASEPIVRITLSTGLLLAICEKLESVGSMLPHEIPEVQHE